MHQPCEVLDQAGHREPHQEQRDQRLLPLRCGRDQPRTPWSSRRPMGRETIKNDFVFAMTGYHPDFDFLAKLGVRMEGEDRLPVCDPKTKESNVSGIYLAGVIVAGSRTNEIFIENGRLHGTLITAGADRQVQRRPGSLREKPAHEADPHPPRAHPSGRLAGGFAGLSAHSPGAGRPHPA